MARSDLAGAWEGASAAGCTNHGRYGFNPCFKVILRQRAALIARLSLDGAEGRGRGGGPALSLALFASEAGASSLGMPPGASPASPAARAASNKGVYSAAACGAALGPVTLEPGSYLLVPSTFDPWPGAYRIALFSNPPAAAISQIQ